MNDSKKIMDDFISTLSHEIRTPLTSIKGFAQTLSDNFDTLDDVQKKKFITIIQEQSQRLINLVENVLSVAKIESGKESVIFKEVNIENVVNSAIELLKMNYGGRNFKTDFAQNTPTSTSDLDKLQQIVLNILENACKYSPPGSDINIKLYNAGTNNILEIKDNGFGINKENLHKIFDKFYRAGDILTNKAQGSGLGLYIAKTLAKQIDADIQVESDTSSDNHYTKFSVIIPVFELEKITKHAAKKD